MTKTYLESVSVEALQTAARESDINAAVFPLQQMLGIETGDVAGMMFLDDSHWLNATEEGRISLLREWLATEELYRD